MDYDDLQQLVDWTCSTWLSLKYIGGEEVFLVLQSAIVFRSLFIRCEASDRDLLPFFSTSFKLCQSICPTLEFDLS